MQKNAREKLVERNIGWEETYTEITARYKEMFRDIVGKGSYFRWEGRDPQSADEYFVVIAPARMKKPTASWFAGCRKLPSDWAAGGKYFGEIKEAMKYANETWGVPYPSGMKYGYDSTDLKNISDKMEEWREERKETQEIQEDKTDKSSSINDFPILFKEAHQRWPKRENYKWFDVEQLIAGDPIFEELAKKHPHLKKSKDAAIKENGKRRLEIAKRYGEKYLNADFYELFLTFSEDQGTYLIVISPYSPYAGIQSFFEDALDRFGVYTKKLNFATQKEIDQDIVDLIQEYTKTYGVYLKPSDFIIAKSDTPNPVLRPSRDVKKMVRESEGYIKNIDYYKNKYKVTSARQAKAKFHEEKRAWDLAQKEAYKEAQKSGKAFEFNIPPPPRVDLMQQTEGSLYFDSIYRKNIPKGMSQDEGISKFGFDSLEEATQFAIAKYPGNFPSQKISAIKDITTADLRKIRIPKELEEKVEEIKTPAKKEKREKTIEKPEEKPKEQLTVPSLEELEKSKIPEEEGDWILTTPSIGEPEKSKTPEEEKEEKEEKEEEDILTFSKRKKINEEKTAFKKTILNLVKLAEILDEENKPEDAEEIHKILRKHMGK